MSSPTPHLIVIGAGILTVPLIERARDMGLGTVVMDGNPDAPGMVIANFPIVVSTKDAAAAARLARELMSDLDLVGVVTAGADVERTVSAVAEAIGRPGPSAHAAYVCNHKVALRKLLAAAGLPGPRFAEVSSASEAADRCHEVGFPLMVKPMDNCGSRGVVRIDHSEDLEKATRDALALSQSGTALLEQFVEGSTHTVEMIAYRGELQLCSMIDTHHGYAPYAVELRHVNPSQLSEDAQREMHDTAVAAARAVGIEDGIAKVDFLYSPDGPVVMEMTARLSGGFHCQATTPLALGTDNLRAAIDVARGVRPRREDIEPRQHRAAICQAVFPPPGRITSVRGIEDARDVPGIEALHLLAGAGDEIPSVQSSADRRFFLIASGDTVGDCERSLALAEAQLQIEVV